MQSMTLMGQCIHNFNHPNSFCYLPNAIRVILLLKCFINYTVCICQFRSIANINLHSTKVSDLKYSNSRQVQAVVRLGNGHRVDMEA